MPRIITSPRSLLAILALTTLGISTASAAERVNSIYGPLYPGKVIYGEPYELPPGWRAYPLSIFRDIYVIRPVRQKVRTNFNLRQQLQRQHANLRARDRKLP